MATSPLLNKDENTFNAVFADCATKVTRRTKREKSRKEYADRAWLVREKEREKKRKKDRLRE